MSSSKSRNTREISDIFHFAAIHFLLERHSAMVLICDRLWENRPLRALLQNRVIGIQGYCRLKAIICGIFFVMEIMCYGALAASVQSLMAYRFKTKSRKL